MKSPMASEGSPQQSDRPLWRNRDFMLLWSGQAISLLGTGITQTAFPLLVWDLTHSAALVGLVGGLGTLPYLFLSLPAGAMVDRWDRKRVMVLCDSGRALNLISLIVALALGHLMVGQLVINALIEGTLFVFFNLAEIACLPRVVTEKQLSAATAQNEATQGTTFLLGPVLGGALYGLRRMLPFVADALSYVVSVIIGGIGGIGGSLLGSPVQKHFRFGQVIIGAVWIQALLWPLYALAPNLLFIGLILALSFSTGPIYNVVSISYRLALIPDALQGRVNSVFRLLAFGFQPLGWAATGLSLQMIGVTPTILALSTIMVLLAIWTTLNPRIHDRKKGPQ
jgi:MFS family permease